MVFSRALWRIRELIRGGRFVITTHADDELAEDGLTLFDVEHCILTGDVVERQRDHATGQWKYVIEGLSVAGDEIATVARVGPRDIVYVVTVFRL